MDKNLEEIKTVPFMGQKLMAAKAEDGTIFAGVSYICNGMGLSKSQKDAQIQNIQKDDVLSRGCLKFQAGVFDPNNTTLALKLDYLPLWLAKISITPTMKAENPQLAERLVQYQLKAKDALAAAFLPKRPNTMAEQLLAQAQFLVEQERRLKALEASSAETSQKMDTVRDALDTMVASSITAENWQSQLNRSVRAFCMQTGFDFHKTFQQLYKETEMTAGVKLDVRVKFAKQRLQANGATQAEITAVSKISIIAKDKKLREIFGNLFNRMVARYKLSGEI